MRDSRLSDAVLTESIRLIEDAGPLDDAQALRGALGAGSRTQQVVQRARLLGRRLALQERIERARSLAPWVLLGIAAVVLLLGLALAGQVVDARERRVNVLGALAALLGLHVLTLLAWLLALAWPDRLIGPSFGRLWLALVARLTLGRGAEPAALLRALTGLLERARLLPWALGLASHAVWSLSFAAVLGALLWAFAFRSYTLAWETTILAPETLVAGVRLLSPLPAWLGFPVPDAAGALIASRDPAGQRDWAWWLIGCVAVYGLLPRVACLLLCAAVWRARFPALAPDFALPYYRRLFARLDALAPPQVVDADGRAGDWRPPPIVPATATSERLALIGFELPPETEWPPLPLPPDVLVQRIAGTAAERQAALDALAQARPRTAVLAVHAASTPDRGTERFTRELLPHCGELRLWLITGAGPVPAAQAQRWRRWLDDAGLPDVACESERDAALRGWA